MPEEMPSWRSLAGSASRSIKGYISQRDPRKISTAPAQATTRDGQHLNVPVRQSWGQWAGQKIQNLRQPNDESTTTAIEKLSLFPGWAVRRYREPNAAGLEEAPFDIEVFVSGYASRFSGPGFGTRSARAFLRIAKTYASLPKLVNGNVVAVEETAEADDGLARPSSRPHAPKQLPPRPDEMAEAEELRQLNEKLSQLDPESDSATADSSSSSRSYTSSTNSHSESRSSHESPPSEIPPPEPQVLSATLQKWHDNLEQRLYPFWSSVISNRSLRVSVFSSDPSLYQTERPNITSSRVSDDDEYASLRLPVATKEVTTAVDGSFQVRLLLRWEDICQHPGALHIAFGDPGLEHELFVETQLMPPPSRPSTPTSTSVPHSQQASPIPRFVRPTVSASLSIPLTYTNVRVISDIDDTVKLSGVLHGARVLFRNVFVSDLGDSVIPGMADWYNALWKRGVRFHYVSNGPFELLPVVNEFIQLSRLPVGSIKLKSYAGRSLFNGLLSAPAERKRANAIDVLDSFPDSRFFLVGDSGEQDLELYATLARERPVQILGIFIRDAHNNEEVGPLDDPTGEQALTPIDEATAAADIQRTNGNTRRTLSVPIPRPRPKSVSYSPPSSPNTTYDFHYTPRRASRSTPETNEQQSPRGRGGITIAIRRPSRTKSEQLGSPVTTPSSYFPPMSPTQMEGQGPSTPPYSRSPTLMPSSSPRSSPPPPQHLSNSGTTTLSSLPIFEELPSLSPPRLRLDNPTLPPPPPPPQQQQPPPPPPPAGQRSSYFGRTVSRSGTLTSLMSSFSGNSSSSGGSSRSNSNSNSNPIGQSGPTTTEAEKKQLELQMRVYKARLEAPRHVPIRVFRDPEECVEAARILDQMHLGKRRLV